MGDHPTEETQFVVDEVSNVIKEAIETTIGGNSYTVRKKDNQTRLCPNPRQIQEFRRQSKSKFSVFKTGTDILGILLINFEVLGLGC